MPDPTAPDGSDPSSQFSNYIDSNGFRVTQNFSGTYDEQHGYMSGEHHAYDIAPPKPGENVPIPAYTDGTVIDTGTTGPYGNHIKVEAPDGTTFLYGHMDSIDVKTGETIAQGDQVGVMGDTGEADGVHLHLEAYQNGKPFDFANGVSADEHGGEALSAGGGYQDNLPPFSPLAIAMGQDPSQQYGMGQDTSSLPPFSPLAGSPSMTTASPTPMMSGQPAGSLGQAPNAPNSPKEVALHGFDIADTSKQEGGEPTAAPKESAPKKKSSKKSNLPA